MLLFIVAACYGYFPGLQTLAIIPATLIAVAASAGLGTAFAGWTVRYRDFRYVVSLFPATGALCLAGDLSALAASRNRGRTWFYVNPMCGALDLFRFGIYRNHLGAWNGCRHSPPRWRRFFFSAAASVFQRVEQILCGPHMKAAISVHHLSKCYRIVHQTGKRYRTLRDDLVDSAKKIFTGKLREQTGEDFWAAERHQLRPFSPGDIVGVIGRNGRRQEHSAQGPYPASRRRPRAKFSCAGASARCWRLGRVFTLS